LVPLRRYLHAADDLDAPEQLVPIFRCLLGVVRQQGGVIGEAVLDRVGEQVVLRGLALRLGQRD
jgi:hypothetical protein